MVGSPSPLPASDLSGPPSPWVVRFAPLIGAGGTVLDLACGAGRHLRFLHQRGHSVLGVDRDLCPLAGWHGVAGLTLLEVDLEDGSAWPPIDALAGPFAGIIVTNYLYRPLFPALFRSLAPNGVLIYETFALGNGRFGRPSSPDFLLRANELLELARGHLHIVAFEQGEVTIPKAAIIQRLCAVASRPTAPDLQGDPEPVPLPTSL